MISKIPEGGFYLGKEGGILNAIIGSLYLGLGSTLFAIVIVVKPAGSYLYEYLRSKKLFLCPACTPVFGCVVGYSFHSYRRICFYHHDALLGMKVSLLAGIIAVGIVVLPIIVRGIDEVMKTIPVELQEAIPTLC